MEDLSGLELTATRGEKSGFVALRVSATLGVKGFLVEIAFCDPLDIDFSSCTPTASLMKRFQSILRSTVSRP